MSDLKASHPLDAPVQQDVPVLQVLSEGACIQQLRIPPQNQNIVLSLPKPNYYVNSRQNPAFIGLTIGRTHNRIADAAVRLNGGQTYRLDANDPPNCLHGGSKSWGYQRWIGPDIDRRNAIDPSAQTAVPSTRFTYLSPDGEGGFPAAVEAKVWYTQWADRESSDPLDQGLSVAVVDIEYEVIFGERTNEGEETVVCLTNHR